MPCPQPEDQGPIDAAAAGPSELPPVRCVRCRSAEATVHFRDASYCESCAKGVFDQKAKAGLEAARGAGIARYISSKSTQPSPDPSNDDREAVNASLALAWSGGMSSRVLLRAASQYFRPDYERNKSKAKRPDVTPSAAQDDDVGDVASVTSKLSSLGRSSEVAKVYVIFIDDSAIISNGKDRTEEARAIVEAEGAEDFEFVGLKLEDVYLAEAGVDAAGTAVECSALPGQDRVLSPGETSVQDRRTALRALFASLHPTDTPRTGIASARTRTEDLHRILVNYLLRREALKRGCAALMLGESGTRMSIRLIESLAKGGGHKLPVEGSEAVWIDDLLVVRPLKAHLIQEVKFFAEVNQLTWLPDQDLVPSAISAGSAFNASGEPLMDKSSIGRLTETFILNLERGVPSTVSTIGRTGSKLVLKTDPSQDIEEEPSPPARALPQAVSFQQVGPSVPLGRKARKAMANDLASSAASMVLEPRVGARGSRLAHTARNLPRWPARKTKRACPLCYMPARSGAKDWKNDITISVLEGQVQPVSGDRVDATGLRQQQTQTQRRQGDEAQIDLASLLCYACILTLETPERPVVVGRSSDGEVDGVTVKTPATMLLPPYVLSNALDRLAPPSETALATAAEANEVQMQDTDPDAEALLDASADKERRQMAADATGQKQSQAQAPRKVGRQEMRRKIDEFLLPAEDDGDD